MPKNILSVFCFGVVLLFRQGQNIGFDLFPQVGELWPELARHGEANQAWKLTQLNFNRALANATRYPIELKIPTATIFHDAHFRNGLRFRGAKLRALGRSFFRTFQYGFNERCHALYSLVNHRIYHYWVVSHTNFVYYPPHYGRTITPRLWVMKRAWRWDGSREKLNLLNTAI